MAEGLKQPQRFLASFTVVYSCFQLKNLDKSCEGWGLLLHIVLCISFSSFPIISLLSLFYKRQKAKSTVRICTNIKTFLMILRAWHFFLIDLQHFPHLIRRPETLEGESCHSTVISQYLLPCFSLQKIQRTWCTDWLQNTIITLCKDAWVVTMTTDVCDVRKCQTYTFTVDCEPKCTALTGSRQC